MIRVQHGRWVLWTSPCPRPSGYYEWHIKPLLRGFCITSPFFFNSEALAADAGRAWGKANLKGWQ